MMSKEKKEEIKEIKDIDAVSKQKKIKTVFAVDNVYSDTQEAMDLYSKSRFGEVKDGRVFYSLVEAMYLLEQKKTDLIYEKKKLKHEEFLKLARKQEPNFNVRYAVFKDLRSRGYIVKTALKFGADFRVYDRGVKPGEDHAKWIVFPVHETEVMSMYEFSAKNRVAHSTRKKLLLAVVDAENDVTWYEVSWIKP